MSDFVVNRRKALEVLAAAGAVAVTGGTPVFAAKETVGGILESLDPDIEVDGFITVKGAKKKSTFDVVINSTNLPPGSELAFYYEEEPSMSEADLDGPEAGPVNAVYLGFFTLGKKRKTTTNFSYSLPYITFGRVTIWLRVSETSEKIAFGTVISVAPK